MTITQTFKRALMVFLHNIQREQKKNQHLKPMASLEKFRPSSIYEIGWVIDCFNYHHLRKFLEEVNPFSKSFVSITTNAKNTNVFIKKVYKLLTW